MREFHDLPRHRNRNKDLLGKLVKISINHSCGINLHDFFSFWDIIGASVAKTRKKRVRVSNLFLNFEARDYARGPSRQ